METQTLLVTFIASTLTMLATGLGVLPFYVLPQITPVWQRRGYAVAGGIMLSACVFDLIFPAIDRGGYVPIIVGLSLGTIFFLISEVSLDQDKIQLGQIRGASARRILLVLGTLFIHSFPEGMAVGVGYGAESDQAQSQFGLLLAIAISLQNIPEGLAVALPLRAAGLSVSRCVSLAIFSSFPQPLAAMPSLLAVTFFEPILPYALAFAAGAMGFLVFSELIPEGLKKGEQLGIGTTIAVGFLGMTIIHALIHE